MSNTKPPRPYPPIALYGVTFQEALNTRDSGLIDHLVAHAEDYLEHIEIVKSAYAALELALEGDRSAKSAASKAASAEKKVSDYVIQPLYGVVIHEAIKSGDADEMKSLLSKAKTYLGEEDTVRELLKKSGASSSSTTDSRG